MLPKQPISVFFGATDQDTSSKKVQLGDVIAAQNLQQIKGGEFSKRPGFLETAQTYPAGLSITSPDSVTSPDGVQVLTRDAKSDHVFARSATATSSQDQGHADRFVPYVKTRIPAQTSGLQQAPMAKQAGNYLVWLVDEGHFKIAQMNPGVLTSATKDADTIVQQVGPIPVAAMSGGASTKVKSFAVIDHATFDTTGLWIIWVDWSANVYAYKIPHSNLSTGTFYTVGTYAPPTNCVAVLTSVTAGMVTTTISGVVTAVLAVACCGVAYDTTALFISPGQHTIYPPTGFRAATGDPANNYAYTITAFTYLANTGGLVEGSNMAQYTADVAGKATASACTIASVQRFQTDPTTWYYAFIGNGLSGDWAIVLMSVREFDRNIHYLPSAAVAPDAYGLPADWNIGNFARLGWFYNGQLAAKETAVGVELAVTPIPYYCPSTGVFRAWNPDYLMTQCWQYRTATDVWALKWQKLGACIAQGWIRLRDYSDTTLNAFKSGKDYLLTTWEDKDAFQTCYHLREWDTGEILAQLAYGEAAHVGHTAARDTQAQGYYSDVQQPMLYGVNQYDQYAALPLSILVGLESQNQNNCVDVADIVLETWDFSTDDASPIWQNPAVVFNFALAPGPIPTIWNGFQGLREAGPLVYPSRPETFVGAGSS